ncbi:MAG: hypothetical protein JSV19_10860 [Phycisphaerales bacterium]|nr:MAG: hypothetical protein JSV19_10860 [Phycisphaerales bacterium]
MHTRSLWSLAVLVGMGVILLSGCADKLTRTHYDMIVVNTSDKFDVEQTLGEPTYKVGDQWHYERVDKHLNVFIHFDAAGNVERKQWIDAMSSEWEDTESPPQDRPQSESTTIRTINE